MSSWCAWWPFVKRAMRATLCSHCHNLYAAMAVEHQHCLEPHVCGQTAGAPGIRCHWWLEGRCKRGSQCKFSHSHDELLPCNYGERCFLRHGWVNSEDPPQAVCSKQQSGAIELTHCQEIEDDSLCTPETTGTMVSSGPIYMTEQQLAVKEAEFQLFHEVKRKERNKQKKQRQREKRREAAQYERGGLMLPAERIPVYTWPALVCCEDEVQLDALVLSADLSATSSPTKPSTAEHHAAHTLHRLSAAARAAAAADAVSGSAASPTSTTVPTTSEAGASAAPQRPAPPLEHVVALELGKFFPVTDAHLARIADSALGQQLESFELWGQQQEQGRGQQQQQQQQQEQQQDLLGFGPLQLDLDPLHQQDQGHELTTDGVIEFVAKCGAGLRRLLLWSVPSVGSNRLLEAVCRHCPELQELAITGHPGSRAPITDGSLTNMHNGKRLPKLRELYCTDTRVSQGAVLQLIKARRGRLRVQAGDTTCGGSLLPMQQQRQQHELQGAGVHQGQGQEQLAALDEDLLHGEPQQHLLQDHRQQQDQQQWQPPVVLEVLEGAASAASPAAAGSGRSTSDMGGSSTSPVHQQAGAGSLGSQQQPALELPPATASRASDMFGLPLQSPGVASHPGWMGVLQSGDLSGLFDGMSEDEDEASDREGGSEWSSNLQGADLLHSSSRSINFGYDRSSSSSVQRLVSMNEVVAQRMGLTPGLAGRGATDDGGSGSQRTSSHQIASMRGSSSGVGAAAVGAGVPSTSALAASAASALFNDLPVRVYDMPAGLLASGDALRGQQQWEAGSPGLFGSSSDDDLEF